MRVGNFAIFGVFMGISSRYDQGYCKSLIESLIRAFDFAKRSMTLCDLELPSHVKFYIYKNVSASLLEGLLGDPVFRLPAFSHHF